MTPYKHTTPVYPMQEVIVVPPNHRWIPPAHRVGVSNVSPPPDTPIYTIELDRGGQWWAVVGGVPLRPMEVLQATLLKISLGIQ